MIFWIDSFILLGCYSITGALIKLMDLIYDEKIIKGFFAQISIFSAAILSGFIAGWLMSHDIGSFIIFTCIIIGVTLAGKVDNLAFVCSIATSIISFLFFVFIIGFGTIFLNIQILIVIFVMLLSSFIDEKGHDYFELRGQSNYKEKDIIGTNKLFKIFFRYRCAMKVCVVCFVFSNFFINTYLTLINAVAFFLFDLSYEIVLLLISKA